MTAKKNPSPRLYPSGRRAFTAALSAVGILLTAASSQATTYYWDTNGATAGSGAATGTWDSSITANWAPDSTGASTSAVTTNTADNLFFSAGTNGTTGTVTVSGTQAANSITFDDPVAVTISGGTGVTLGGTTGAGIFQTANAANTISTGLTLGSAVNAFNFSNSTASLLTIGAVTGSATTGTQTITVGSSSTGGITLNGIIGDGAAGGKVALTVNNTSTGITVLSGANTYTGGTTVNAGTLQLTNVGTNASGPNKGTFNLGGGTLQINQSGSNFAYGAALNLTADSTFSNVGTGAINQNGAITGNSHALTVNNTGNRMYINGTVSGVTQFNVTAGAMGFDLSGGNSGGGAAVNVSNGASLWVVNSTVTSTNNITLNGGAGYNSTGALFQENSNNTSTLSGTVTLNNGTSSIGVGSATGTILLSGKVTGTGGITKIGSGTLTLSNSTNDYAGATTVNAGTLAITGNSTGLTGGFVVNSNGNTASTFTLNGNTGSIASNAAIQLNGGIFNYQNTGVSSSTFDASGYNFSGGDRTYQSTFGGSNTSAVLNLASATRTAGTTNNYTTSGGTNGTTNKITFTSAPTAVVLADKGNFFNGTSYLAYDAGGYARAYDYTESSGATSTGGATLGSVTGKNVDLTTAAVTAQTTDSINTLRLGTANGVTMASSSDTLSVDGILKSGGTAATIGTGNIQTVSSGGEMVIRTNASGDTLTISSIIANNGGSSLTKSGLGTLALNAANTYAGGTSLTGGIVTFNNNTSFGTGSITAAGVTIRNTGGVTTTNNLVVNGATTLDVNTGNWNLNGNISGSGDITRGTNANLSLYLGGDNSGYTGTFTNVNNANAVTRFNSATSGSASAKWAFNNTNTGKTTLSWSGTGTISFGSMTGSGDIRTDVTGAKTISAGSLGLNDTFSGTIVNGTGTIALIKVGTGTMTLSGANTYTGATTVSAGALSVTGSLASGSAVSVASGATLRGTGTIGGATTIASGGTLKAGISDSSIGTLTFSSTLDTTSATVSLKLNSTNGTFDALSANGVTLGNATLLLTELGNGTWTGGSTFTIVNNTSATSVSGTFSGLIEGSTIVVGSNSFTISYVGGTGNDITLTASAVPEPATYAAILGSLALGAVAVNRRRRSKLNGS